LPPFCHRILVPSSFDCETANDRLLKLLRVRYMPSDLSCGEVQIADSMRLSAVIDPRELLSIGCAGAVLGDFYRMLSAGFLSSVGSPDSFRIGSIAMFSLSDTMYVTAESLHSLQIIRSEGHPSSQGCNPSATDGSKESLSLLGLLQPHARTPQGKARLRNLLVRPSTNLELIKARLHSISVLCAPQNTEVLNSAHAALKSMCNCRASISKLRMGIDAMTGKGAINRGI